MGAHTVALTERHRDHKTSDQGDWGNAIEAETRVIHIPFDVADGSGISVAKSFDTASNEAVIRILDPNPSTATLDVDSTDEGQLDESRGDFLSHIRAGASGGDLDLTHAIGSLMDVGAKRFTRDAD